MTGMVTTAQIRKLYLTAREHGVDDDLLHEHAARLTGKESIRLLTREDAARVIDSLEGKPASGKDHITQKQRYYLLGLARKLGWTDESGRVDEKRLDGMSVKYAKVSRFEWLTRSGASKLIEAMKSMASRTDEGAGAGTETGMKKAEKA